MPVRGVGYGIRGADDGQFVVHGVGEGGEGVGGIAKALVTFPWSVRRVVRSAEGALCAAGTRGRGFWLASPPHRCTGRAGSARGRLGGVPGRLGRSTSFGRRWWLHGQVVPFAGEEAHDAAVAGPLGSQDLGVWADFAGDLLEQWLEGWSLKQLQLG